MTTLLDSRADIQWLLDGHLSGCIVPPFTVAAIEGNEDWPDSITLYEEDHVNSLTLRLTPDDDGNFTCNRRAW